MAEGQARRFGISIGEWLNRAIRDEIAPEASTTAPGFGRLGDPADEAMAALDRSHAGHTAYALSAMEANLLAHGAFADSARLPAIWTRVAELLGGLAILRRDVEGPLDAHELLQDGLPARALTHLVDHVQLLRSPDQFEKAVGMSQRTLQRRREELHRPLNTEQSGRAWKFAEVLAKATAVFGSQAEAELWLQRPAMGLNQNKPLDLLSTAAGVEAVEEHLGRLEYGVYA
ncbi:type II toxin-antitoxin system Xre/ParS family antitoxin [Phenylobacterium sp.]|uniref:type II RES/Xre toxin-antitoxin system antitoxin n=1 Tax=Phenylobacterium sp. TaxID=1871053 RepID=UPI003BAA9880